MSCFLPYAIFYDMSKTYQDIKFGKKVKTIIVVDISLHSFSKIGGDITRERLRMHEKGRKR